MEKINESKKILIVLLALIFVLMLVANTWSYYCSDDYGYKLSSADGSQITCVKDIVRSIATHCKTVNGRSIAHFLAQLFLLMPKTVFNFVSSAIFAAMVYLCCRISTDGKINNILLLAVFGAIWCFMPAFGSAYIWLTGTCNYLWGVFFVLLFVLPYSNCGQMDSIVLKVLFVIAAFVAGAYTEATSAGGILAAALFVLYYKFVEKRRVQPVYFIAIAMSVAGYLTMIFAPAEIRAKSTGLTVYSLFDKFVEATQIYSEFMPVIIVFIIMLILCDDSKAKWKALIFAVTSLATNYIFVFARYYPPRGACATGTFLIIAAGILADSVYRSGKFRKASVIACALMIPFAVLNVAVGMGDIRTTNAAMKETLAVVEKYKAEGYTEVPFSTMYPDTKYTVYSDTMQLNYYDTKSFPNAYMAKFYGVDVIVSDVPDFDY